PAERAAVGPHPRRARPARARAGILEHPPAETGRHGSRVPARAADGRARRSAARRTRAGVHVAVVRRAQPASARAVVPPRRPDGARAAAVPGHATGAADRAHGGRRRVPGLAVVPAERQLHAALAGRALAVAGATATRGRPRREPPDLKQGSMVEVRDTERELYQLRLRLVIAMTLVLVCFGVLVARFVYLQVYRYEDFHAQAEDNRIALVPASPGRGLIFDRNGVLLAENVSAYTLEIAPKGAAKLEETIAALSGIVEITPRDRQRFRRLLEDSRSTDSVPLKVRLTDEEVARLAAQRFRFPGVEIRARLFRNYPLGETAAHVIGHIGRISQEDKRRLEEQERLSAYAGSTHIGKVGVELSYESLLHGQVGAEEVEVSAGGRIVRTLSRQPPVPGANLVLSIDVRLQKLAEELYGDRRGALVAI